MFKFDMTTFVTGYIWFVLCIWFMYAVFCEFVGSLLVHSVL